MHHLRIFAFTMNLEGYCVALPKPKRNAIPTPYCDNILNHDIIGGNVKLVTLMVKGNEIIIKMSLLQLQFKTLFKSTLYHQCGKYYITLIYMYQQFYIGPLNHFYHL
jgi:hypothetical protein